MKALFLPATLIFLAALSRPLDGSSPNLLANGGFEGGLQSWGRTENVTWSPAFGGAARIAQTPHAGWEALSQCAPVDGNALYVISASANLPRRPTATAGFPFACAGWTRSTATARFSAAPRPSSSSLPARRSRR